MRETEGNRKREKQDGAKGRFKKKAREWEGEKERERERGRRKIWGRSEGLITKIKMKEAERYINKRERERETDRQTDRQTEGKGEMVEGRVDGVKGN